MPCTAKKDEAVRPGMSGDIDHVITTRELARMMRVRGLALGAFPDDGRFDSPLGESTGAGQIFGASGGVMEAMVRTAAHLRGADDAPPLEWQSLRGVGSPVKTAEIPGIGTVAVCNGIAAAQQLLANDDWRSQFVAIEVMACVGGCLGGGGEPKSLDPRILERRTQAIYEIDRQAPLRRSHENPDVQRLYSSELGAPNSVAARALLHTSYAARRSKRLLLMRFLDCVDRRDARGAASLFHPDGQWSTATEFGDVGSAPDIEALIATRLPARRSGPDLLRHRMASSADPDDLTVITPTGESCRFDVEIDTINEGSGSTQVIRKLVRHCL